MVSTYELIKRNENSMDFVLMLKKGIINISIFDRKCYYEYYLEKLKVMKKNKAVIETAIKFDITIQTVYNCLKFMT